MMKDGWFEGVVSNKHGAFLMSPVFRLHEVDGRNDGIISGSFHPNIPLKYFIIISTVSQQKSRRFCTPTPHKIMPSTPNSRILPWLDPPSRLTKYFRKVPVMYFQSRVAARYS